MFNFSAINNLGQKKASGEYLLFLNNDTEVIRADWMRAMIEQAQRPEVGAVGAKLLFPDNRIQHAGAVLGMGGIVGHAFRLTAPQRAALLWPRRCHSRLQRGDRGLHDDAALGV